MAGAGMKRAWVVAAAFVAATASAQDKAQGIAGQVCAACHAPDGNSVAAANPKIAGQISEYLQKQLRDFKAQGGKKPLRESAVMNGMVANLSEDDMKGLATFYAGQKLWRGGDTVHGIPACGGCHGPAGAGIPAQFPRLSGQFAEYVAAQLTAFREGKRTNDQN